MQKIFPFDDIRIQTNALAFIQAEMNQALHENSWYLKHWYFNALRFEQVSLNFADNFSNIFSSMKISPIVNGSSLVQLMAWHLTGDKPLPEPMIIHICDIICGH